MSLEQRPIASLNKKEGDYQAKISAYGNVSSALSGFQTSLQDLTKPEKFQSQKASSSDTEVFTATASAKASPGTHSLSVSSLSRTQKLAVAGQASDVTSIGTGTPATLTFDFGSIEGGNFDEANGKYKDASFKPSGQGSKTVIIDSGNNTLKGIHNAINAANIGITATIINDGSDTPYRMTLSPSGAGSTSSIKISVSGEEAIAALLAHDPAGTQNLTETSTSKNAVFTIDGVTISKPSNSISDVIPGVTLELLDTSSTPVTLTVGRESTSITNSIQSFVKGYNDLNKTLQDLSSYNATTKQGAILQGDSTLRVLQSQIRAVLNTPVNNTGGAYNNLTQIGITLQKDGTMSLDTTKLNAAITSNPQDVASLFASVGTASDPLLSYGAAGAKTGSFPVNVTKLATRGSLGGCEEVESLVIEAGENDGLNVSVNGVSAAIVLSPGKYTEDGLATEIQSKINGANTLSGAGISVTVVHDQFGYLVTSNTFGSKSSVDISGTGALNLFGKTPVHSKGTDVEGTINGSPATGSGQTLTASSGAALGLKIDVSGGALGERGKISYSQGYAHTLNNLITSVLAKDGQLESRKKGINSSIKDVGNRRETLQQRLPLQEARLRKQYSKLETTLNNMSKTSSYLSQQIANQPKPR
jgi:flagellar hook-associated protein 2